MIDAEHPDLARVVVDLVDHVVDPPSGRPHAFELASQRVPHPPGSLPQRSDHELDDRSRNPLGKAPERSLRAGGHDQAVVVRAQLSRYLARSASASTVWPSAISRRATRISSMATGSDRSSW